MVDNLRRTLSAPAALLALLAGWLLPFVDTKLWTALVLVSIAMPALLPFLSGILPRRLGISKRTHASSLAADFELAFGQTALLTTLLADQAWLMADAIGRTLYRLFLSHRRLLEWVTAAQVQLGAELDLAGFYRQMAGGCVLAVVAGILVAWLQPSSLPLAAPFLALWLLAPAIARWVSQPPPEAIHRPVSFADARTLRLVARRTWHFFESFVTAEDNMLPPDNFQEDPKPTVAHRTSPTNFGMYLLSVLAARDFAWLGHLDAADRLEATFATMGKLERFRGHFFNWYDTRDLRPLEPKYVSSVDSGNLAGHLIALANACRESIDPAIANGHWIAGVEDALALARDALPSGPAQASVRKQLEAAFTVMDGALAAAAEPAGDLAHQLATLALQADGAIDLAKKLAGEGSAGILDDTLIWLRALRESIGSHQRDLDELMPAAAPLAEDVAARADGSGRSGSTRGHRRSPCRPPGAAAPSPGVGGAGLDGLGGDGIRLSSGPRAPAALDRLPGRRGQPGSQLLRSACLRGASCELRGHRQGRCADPALVPARACRDPGGSRLGADLLVRLDVRISDALARHARARPAA